MKSRLISENGEKIYAIVFDPDDEVMKGLKEFAGEHRLTASSFKAIGALRRATLGYFDFEKKEYEKIPVNEQVELLSLIGDIALDEKGKPQIHAHCVVGKRDGSAHGGHLLEAIVNPTLEVILTENPTTLKKTFRPEFGIALIDLDK